MAKIKIKDLPKDEKISEEEMKKVMGGWTYSPISYNTLQPKIVRPDTRGGIYGATPIEIP